MRRIIGFFLIGAGLWPALAEAGPVFDPFLERFQVGTYAPGDTFALAHGFPADLLEPVQIDTVWVEAAGRVFDALSTADPPFLTPELASLFMGEDKALAWRAQQKRVVHSLTGEIVSGASDWFLAERLARSVFDRTAAGDHAGAAAICRQIRDAGPGLGLSSRAMLVWDLRARQLDEMNGQNNRAQESSWDLMFNLGPFDSGNAWTLWVAHCRDRGVPPLGLIPDPKQLGDFLGGISGHKLEPEELYASVLSDDYKAALGGIMFRGGNLAKHFERYGQPPADFRLQGWWVQGMRLHLKGRAPAYEALATRQDIHPGWRMDVLRRASEVRLLKGQWEPGLLNLEQALQLAGAGQGTRSQRRRLRQWNEQALVLALAAGDPKTARTIRDLGLQHLQGEQRDAFIRETGHWAGMLDGVTASSDLFLPTIKAAAQALVETGDALNLAPADSLDRAAFLEASDRTLWSLWFQWGLSLADPEAVTGKTRDRAIVYRDALLAGREEKTDLSLAQAALEIIALRFRGRPEADSLLRQALDYDVGQASGWTLAQAPSAVPDLATALKGSELDRHALLGFALACGDMRGILAVSVVLEGRGLSGEQKMRFLYPLPKAGPIREAIAAADSPPALLLAVARNESLFEPSVRSRAGALGWMQIMPFHYVARGAVPGPDNWRRPSVSIGRGDGLLVENRRRYQGDPYAAVAAYNAGPKAASRWREQLGGAPARSIYLAWIGYPETRHYVEKVLIDRHIYDWIIAGNETP